MTLPLTLVLFTGGDRPNVPDTLIIVTDGLPNQEVDRTIPEAINAQIDGKHSSYRLSESISDAMLKDKTEP